MTDNFPLITLQPALNSGNAWVALLLEGDHPLDGAMLARVLNGGGLAEVLDTVACIVLADPERIDPGLAAGWPRDRVVLRFPVAVGSDPARHESLAALRDAGFALMVTGFPAAGETLFSGIASLAIPCPGSHIPIGLGDWLRKLPGPHLALGTTEKVCPGFCKFHWLSGHLAGHAAPTVKSDPTTRSLLLRLLSLVTRDAESSDLEALIKRDPSLSYQLLKLVNSVAISPTRKIGNFAQAIVMLGRRQLQRWLQLLLYARPPGSQTASPLLPRAALRASLMEGLAKRQGLAQDSREQAFMVGMFSLLEVLFGVPLAEIVAPLNLPEDVVLALTANGADSGPFGALLAVVVASEGPPTPVLAAALDAVGITREAWLDALTEALRWAVQVSREA
ncbi:MAG: HDOD domain-containing protein [Rhodocyclaceae bacterium]|nr:HDOD domain-containing protein [Rhodocyclaceae bacterium]